MGVLSQNQVTPTGEGSLKSGSLFLCLNKNHTFKKLDKITLRGIGWQERWTDFMSILSDLKKLDSYDITIIVIMFSSSVAPGFLILLFFKPELVLSLDVLKLTLLSLAFTTPQIILAALLIFISNESRYVKCRKTKKICKIKDI